MRAYSALHAPCAPLLPPPVAARRSPGPHAAIRAAAKAEYLLLLVGIAVLAIGAVTLSREWLWVPIPGGGMPLASEHDGDLCG